jgi:hypothetical protein
MVARFPCWPASFVACRPKRAVYADALGALTRRLTDQLGKLGRPDPESLAGSVLAEMVGAVALARARLYPADTEAILARSGQPSSTAWACVTWRARRADPAVQSTKRFPTAEGVTRSPNRSVSFPSARQPVQCAAAISWRSKASRASTVSGIIASVEPARWKPPSTP